MRDDAPALIFGPDPLPPTGTHGVLSISELGAEVSAAGRSRRAALSAVSLRETGFDRPGLEVAWRDETGAWAAHVLDPDAARRLLNTSALASTDQALALRLIQRRSKAGRSIGTALLASMLVLPLALLVWFVLNADAMAARLADAIPIDQEVAMGRQMFEGMRGSLALKDEAAAYDAVRSIVATLTRGSRYTYDVHIVDDPSLNAFAIPGGIIVVHSGLIAATSRPEELAGVLAHEVQHVELRHSLRGLIKDLGLRGLWSYAIGDLGGSLVGRAALELTSLSFSRDDERKADEAGLTTMAAAGIDPDGMPDVFGIMAERGGDAPAAFLSTHPLSEDRERHLRQLLEATNRTGVAPLPFAPWPPK
jgi:Zn-dependent protease with chaperone function